MVLLHVYCCCSFSNFRWHCSAVLSYPLTSSQKINYEFSFFKLTFYCSVWPNGNENILSPPLAMCYRCSFWHFLVLFFSSMIAASTSFNWSDSLNHPKKCFHAANEPDHGQLDPYRDRLFGRTQFWSSGIGPWSQEHLAFHKSEGSI